MGDFKIFLLFLFFIMKSVFKETFNWKTNKWRFPFLSISSVTWIFRAEQWIHHWSHWWGNTNRCWKKDSVRPNLETGTWPLKKSHPSLLVLQTETQRSMLLVTQPFVVWLPASSTRHPMLSLNRNLWLNSICVFLFLFFFKLFKSQKPIVCWEGMRR